jgi:hypothetical protein
MRLARTMCTTPMVSVIFIIVSTSFRFRTFNRARKRGCLRAGSRRNRSPWRYRTTAGRHHQPWPTCARCAAEAATRSERLRSRNRHDQHQQAVAGIGHDHAEEDDKGNVDDRRRIPVCDIRVSGRTLRDPRPPPSAGTFSRSVGGSSSPGRVLDKCRDAQFSGELTRFRRPGRPEPSLQHEDPVRVDGFQRRACGRPGRGRAARFAASR